MNTQDWSPLGWTGWISLQSKGLSRVSSNTTFKSINSLALRLLYSPTLTSIHNSGKAIAWTRRTFVGKVMSLLFNKLSRFVIAFFSKEQVSFNFLATVTICSDFGAQENKVCHCFHFYPVYLPWSDGTKCHDLSFVCLIIFLYLFYTYFSLFWVYFATQTFLWLQQAGTSL